MEIKTKFDVEQIVFYMAEKGLEQALVKGIQVNVSVANVKPPSPVIKYHLDNGTQNVIEHRLFASREEIAELILTDTFNDCINGRSISSTNDVEAKL